MSQFSFNILLLIYKIFVQLLNKIGRDKTIKFT